MINFKIAVAVNLIGDHGSIKNGSGEAIIIWTANLEVREYGIETLNPCVADQTIEVTLSRYDEETEEDIEYTEIINITDVKVRLYPSEDRVGLRLVPTELEIYKGEFTLLF